MWKNHRRDPDDENIVSLSSLERRIEVTVEMIYIAKGIIYNIPYP